MARVTVIKNFAEFKPSVANIVISSILGDTNIDKHDPSVTYKAGDKVYIIQDGKIIIKECINDNTTGNILEKDWITIDSGLGGSSTTQNPNSYQSISYFENKLATDIGILTTRLDTLTNVDNLGLTNTHIIPLYEQSEVTLTKGKYEFGRIFV